MSDGSGGGSRAGERVRMRSHLPVLKAHGSQNDILVIEGRPGDYAADADVPHLVRQLCDRSGPLGGGDGVYFVDLAPAVPQAAFFNPDGSFAKLCGNGMRCVGRLVLDTREADRAVVRAGGSDFVVLRAESTPEGVRQTAVEMPKVDFDPAEPVLALAQPHVDTPVPALHPTLGLTALAVPNDHLVAVVEKFDEAELVATGLRIVAATDVVPRGANLSFVFALDDDEIYVQTYERGAGLTPSCGSGVVASRAVWSRLGHADAGERITVRNPGGVATAWLTGDGSAWQATLQGNASYVYRADVDLAAVVSGVVGRVERDTFVDEVEAFAQLRRNNHSVLHAAGVYPSVG
ncbi:MULTISPECIES: diaminopimelate epimerase [unclassified Solwaraspora]|uniref:diaminopimelate epimerase n=1 Tax=unclassified Solwaraspora TaxID=2627926 RepID=UPI00259B7F01|nr:diaminopimelate epimerase [Solwaraspora sp. WMMA2056]WJK39255.1 diaminopimelate epimerase [Solwaraspora sp. WMMA2056]